MRFTRKAPAVLLALASATLVSPACSRPAPPSPGDAVSSLYQVLIDSQVTGAPTPGQLAAMAPYLSTELRELLRAAGALRDSAARANPDEKPPFAEGDLFTSLFEGPSSMVVQALPGGGGLRLPVSFSYDGIAPPVSWVDTVVVTTDAGRPVVADVVYGGTWHFANRGALVASLRAAGLSAPAR